MLHCQRSVVVFRTQDDHQRPRALHRGTHGLACVREEMPARIRGIRAGCASMPGKPGDGHRRCFSGAGLAAAVMAITERRFWAGDTAAVGRGLGVYASQRLTRPDYRDAKGTGMSTLPRRRGRTAAGDDEAVCLGSFEVYRAVPRAAMPITLESCS